MLTGFILVILFLFSAVDLHAADITHSVQKTDFHALDEVEFDVSLTVNAEDGTEYFLRGVFFQPGDNSYCGYTWNGSNWFSGPYSTGEQWSNFLRIAVTDNTWSGKLKAKIDPEDSGCTKSGEYHFKIQRFTGSGAGNFDNQTETSLNFTIPTHTPTPQPTTTPTKTPKPTKIPTSTPAPKSNSRIPTNTTPADKEGVTSPRNVLGKRSVSGKNKKTTPTKARAGRSPTQNAEENEFIPEEFEDEEKENNTKKGGNIFVYLGGGSLLASCGILLLRAYRQRRGEG